MIPQSITDYIIPAITGGLGVAGNKLWNHFTTKKERELARRKNSVDVLDQRIEAMEKIIKSYNNLNENLEDKIRKYEEKEARTEEKRDKDMRRIGALEDTLRKQSFEHQKKIEEIDLYWKEQVNKMEKEQRKALQEIESYYREKCRECEIQK